MRGWPQRGIFLYLPKGLTIDKDSTLKPNIYAAYSTIPLKLWFDSVDY